MVGEEADILDGDRAALRDGLDDRPEDHRGHGRRRHRGHRRPRRGGRRPPAGHGLRGAGHPPRQPADHPGRRVRRERHPLRAVRGAADRPLPDRRRAARGGVAAEAPAGRDHLARQAHGEDEHRRAPAAPGRPHPRARRRPRDRHPRLDRPDGLRREPRAAPARPLARPARPGDARLRRRRLRALRAADRAPLRHAAGHGPDRQRQDHDALRGARPAQLPGEEDHHDRGPRRVPAHRDQPDPGAPEDRPDVRRRGCAPSCARTRT